MPASRLWALVIGLFAAGAVGLGLAAWHPWAWRHWSFAAPQPVSLSARPAADAPGASPSAVVAPVVAQRPTPATAPASPDQPTAPPEPSTSKPSPSKPPQFDVVRVEPSGDAVVAGRADPNSRVALVDRGEVVGEARADGDGNFVMVPPALKPGKYDLSLRQSVENKPAVASQQTVAAAVPAKVTGQAVTALAEPGKASRVLDGPMSAGPALAARGTAGAPPPASQHGDQQVAIRSAEIENGGGFHAAGIAAPGSRVELYLNGSHLAAVSADADGAWSVRVRKGLTGGRYAVRADAVEPGGRVIARAEVPFQAPAPSGGPAIVAPASAPALAATTQASAGQPAADVLIDEIETATVMTGDNLWRMSRTRLGEGHRYTQIYAANVAQIRDPKLIYPGQVLVVPGK